MLKLNRREVRSRMALQYDTQADFAKDIGVSRTWLSGLMSGKEEPSTALLVRMTTALDCKIDDITEYPVIA